ncbi:MAG: ABC transporter permease, partial [Phocaeicola sp.]|nr:ABC transporter permease [Phocaeicola sp.]
VEITLARLYNGQDMEALNAEQKPLELRSNNNIPSLYQLFPLSQFYFDENVHYYGDSIIKKGNQRNVWILILVAAMLMPIGIFPYLNIYTVM